jgi:hypothetical protein
VAGDRQIAGAVVTPDRRRIRPFAGLRIAIRYRSTNGAAAGATGLSLRRQKIKSLPNLSRRPLLDFVGADGSVVRHAMRRRAVSFEDVVTFDTM